MKSFKNVIAASALATLSMSANASIVSYSDFASFASAITDPLIIDDFESYAANPDFAATQNFNGFYMAEVGDAGDNVIKSSFTGAFDEAITSGVEAFYTYTNTIGASTIFGSAAGAGYAFGTNVTTDKDTTVTLTVNGQDFTQSFLADTTQFFGVIGTGETFGNVAFEVADVKTTIGFDDVAFVGPVPEASTLAMMAGGLGLVGFMAARRRKQA